MPPRGRLSTRRLPAMAPGPELVPQFDVDRIRADDDARDVAAGLRPSCYRPGIGGAAARAVTKNYIVISITYVFAVLF
jgi:hypothetical protein